MLLHLEKYLSRRLISLRVCNESVKYFVEWDEKQNFLFGRSFRTGHSSGATYKCVRTVGLSAWVYALFKINYAQDLADHFDMTYVNETHRRIFSEKGTLKLRKCLPIFSPSTWNVYEFTLNYKERNTNHIKSWNERFSKLVGHCHLTI